jgi:FKBP-type peptidyl-prolyl cis-trans isomerase 2
VRFVDAAGRRRLIRILEADDTMVLVDTNRRGAGQALDLEVELVDIQSPEAVADSPKR